MRLDESSLAGETAGRNHPLPGRCHEHRREEASRARKSIADLGPFSRRGASRGRERGSRQTADALVGTCERRGYRMP
jgi:hypothetical protein